MILFTVCEDQTRATTTSRLEYYGARRFEEIIMRLAGAEPDAMLLDIRCYTCRTVLREAAARSCAIVQCDACKRDKTRFDTAQRAMFEHMHRVHGMRSSVRVDT